MLAPLTIIFAFVLERSGIVKSNPLTRFLADTKYATRVVNRCHRKYCKHRILDTRSYQGTDAIRRLGPGMLSRRYGCGNLANVFASFAVRDDGGTPDLEELQKNAMSRLESFHFHWGQKFDSHPFPVDYFFQIFNDYFFLGALGEHVWKVQLVEESFGDSNWIGLTSRPSGKLMIQIKKPLGDTWTLDLVRGMLNVLLHEMVHTYLEAFSCPIPAFIHHLEMVLTEGLTGHGPSWRKVARAVEIEAIRSLGWLWDGWTLSIHDGHLLENGAVVELVKKKKLILTAEEAKVVFGDRFHRVPLHTREEWFVETGCDRSGDIIRLG